MELHAHLNQFHVISDADFQLLSATFKTKTFKKGTHLVVPGQIQKELYFVKSGIVMSHLDHENKSHVIAFSYAPDPCAIPDSFSMQLPSRYFLTAMSDCEMDTIRYEDIQHAFDQSQQVERLFRKMTELILAGMISRHMELHAMTMEERYLVFCRRSAHLLQLVPHKYIASYLGIDPTNFSKLFNQVKF